MISSLASSFPQISLHRRCQLLGVSRSSAYRKSPEDAWRKELISQIQSLVIRFTGYGYRRVWLDLRGSGMQVSQCLVRRLMREEGLCVPKPRKLVGTTKSKGHPEYPNLVGTAKPSAPNEVWAADMTMIRTQTGTVYLATLLDICTRKCVSWHISRSADVKLALECLSKAIAKRKPQAGWIHHSDHGSVYTSLQYVSQVRQAGGRLSMASIGRPQENGYAESFFKTLKQEEVLLNQYSSFLELDESLSAYIDGTYNAERRHSRLNYLSPDQFETLLSKKEGS
jgi:putative transposase